MTEFQVTQTTLVRKEDRICWIRVGFEKVTRKANSEFA